MTHGQSALYNIPGKICIFHKHALVRSKQSFIVAQKKMRNVFVIKNELCVSFLFILLSVCFWKIEEFQVSHHKMILTILLLTLYQI